MRLTAFPPHDIPLQLSRLLPRAAKPMIIKRITMYSAVRTLCFFYYAGCFSMLCSAGLCMLRCALPVPARLAWGFLLQTLRRPRASDAGPSACK